MQNLDERADFEQETYAYLDSRRERFQDIVVRGMLNWQKRFPKRSLSFMDAMGMTLLGISAGPNEDPYEVSAMLPHTAVGRQCKELIELLNWYNEVSENLNLQIDDIVIGEPIWPIHRGEQRSYAGILDGE